MTCGQDKMPEMTLRECEQCGLTWLCLAANFLRFLDAILTFHPVRNGLGKKEPKLMK